MLRGFRRDFSRSSSAHGPSGHAGRRSTGRVAATYVLLAGLQRGILLLILPFISHAMTPAEYGAASMLTAAALLLTAVVAGPLDSLVFRTMARQDTETPALLRVSGIYCYLIVPIIAAIAASIVAFFGPAILGVAGSVWAVEILAVGFQPAMTVFALPAVQAQHDLRKFIVLASISILSTAASKLVLVVVLRLGVMGWVISDLVSAAVAAVAAIAVVRLPRAQVTRSDIRTAANFAAPMIPHRAMIWAVMSLSRPALAVVSTLTQVGLLSLGLNLASGASVVLSEINRSVMPHYSRETFPAPTANTLSPVRWQMIGALLIPAAVGSFTAIVGPWLFAQSYWRSLPLAGVLLLAQAAFGIYLIPMNYLTQTAGLPKYSSIASGAGGGLILVSILIFGERTGAMGVAVATVAGYSVMAIAAVVLVRGHRLDIAWSAWSPYWPVLLLGCAALGSSVTALQLPVGSMYAFGLGMAGFALGLGAVSWAALRGRS